MAIKEPVIFDPENRTPPRTWEQMELVYDNPTNNTLMFLNELPGKYGEFLRDMSHRWLRAMPDGGDEISARLNPSGRGRKYEGVKDDWEFRASWWQMFINQIFRPKSVSSELLALRGDTQTSLKFILENGEEVLVDCCFVHDHSEQMQLEEMKRKYQVILNQAFAGSRMCAMLCMHYDQPLPPEWAINCASEYCMKTPIGGRADIFYDGNQVLITDEEISKSRLSSTLIVTPSRTMETIVDVPITRTYSGDSKHLEQIELSLSDINTEDFNGKPFILAVSTNLNEGVFDAPALYRTLYENDDSIFMSGKWDHVSGILIGSPLPWNLSYISSHEVPLTLFINPNASCPLLDTLTKEVPYVVDTVKSKVHHDIRNPRMPDILLSDYLADENFNKWEQLRQEFESAKSERRELSLSPETVNKLQTLNHTSQSLTEEQIEWLQDTGILGIYEYARKKLPWGGSASREITLLRPGILQVTFDDADVSIAFEIDIPDEKCKVSVTLARISEVIFQHSYSLSFRGGIWSAITDIYKVLHPDTVGITYLQWKSETHSLPENITNAINNILQLHQNSNIVPMPDISAEGDTLMVHWRFPRNMIFLMAGLESGNTTWLDHATGTRVEFPVNDESGWQDLQEYLLSIPPTDPLG